MPDYHNVSPDAVDASAKAVRAGTDVECGNAYRKLPEAVRRGELSEQDIDRRMRNAREEVKFAGDYDYLLVNDAAPEETFKTLKAIADAEKCKTSRLTVELDD